MGFFRWILLGRSDGLRAGARRRLRQLMHPGRQAGVGVPDPEPASGAPTATAETLGAAVEAPGSFVAVLPITELDDGALAEVFVAGRSVALARVGDRVYALDGTCPHAGGPLAEGRLDGSTLCCPMHGWSFDVTTGECHVNPDDRIPVLSVRVVEGMVCVQQ